MKVIVSSETVPRRYMGGELNTNITCSFVNYVDQIYSIPVFTVPHGSPHGPKEHQQQEIETSQSTCQVTIS